MILAVCAEVGGSCQLVANWSQPLTCGRDQLATGYVVADGWVVSTGLDHQQPPRYFPDAGTRQGQRRSYLASTAAQHPTICVSSTTSAQTPTLVHQNPADAQHHYRLPASGTFSTSGTHPTTPYKILSNSTPRA
ncbi:hypothetical protein FIBSPDRAFT_266298 [Athelia psychrophila]|uniref:Uncharacterized protein n=1 Tax=Athelia psychrophila TaxID=1759441 RepID=A0A165X5D6_9AGAM|nr:hypothetical protein FIBSPDRAFT_266298 [Fibularhizoctonia sp. CBS 109695]